MKQRLQWRLMAAFALFTLAVSLMFGLFAMVFVYTVEDRFLERRLQQEATRQWQHFDRHGRWAPLGTDDRQRAGDGLVLHASTATLPADLARALAAQPRLRETPGDDGRHYHLLSLREAGQPPWLVAEVSGQLIVRPVRRQLLGLLAGWGLAGVVLSMALAAWLARRISRPLEGLATQLAATRPEHLPTTLDGTRRDDEIGALARSFESLLARTREFIGREQAFSRDASHELRTPLAVLRMSIERLQGSAVGPAELQRQLASMAAATRLMEQTVHTLLLLARETPDAAAAPVAVLPLVERWVVAHEAALDRRGLTLDLRLHPGDTLALPEPVLQWALASLLDNACTHGRAGGCIALEMTAGGLRLCNPSEPPPAGVGEEGVKGEASSGSGLGLSIVGRLLERHRSRLQLTHRDGLTCVTLDHPAPPPAGP